MQPQTKQPFLDLHFPVRGGPLEPDHGWALFSAICRIRPLLHDRLDIKAGPIQGCAFDGQRLRLQDGAFLPIRLPADATREVYPLAGKTLDIRGSKLTLGIPTTKVIQACESLHARLVIFTNRLEWLAFEEELRRQLALLDATPTIQPGRRRAMRVKGDAINVGFALGLSDLSPEASLRLQHEGLGTRKHMGAGFFIPGPLPPHAHATLRDLGLDGKEP